MLCRVIIGLHFRLVCSLYLAVINYFEINLVFLLGSDSIENDIIIDDEGISDIAKHNGIVINPSKVCCISD